jgi:hypothetical protein
MNRGEMIRAFIAGEDGRAGGGQPLQIRVRQS